jgi:hypothetical protein
MKENLDSKHECEFYFMDLVTPAIKKNVNCEKRTNTGFDIYIILVFFYQYNPE